MNKKEYIVYSVALNLVTEYGYFRIETLQESVFNRHAEIFWFQKKHGMYKIPPVSETVRNKVTSLIKKGYLTECNKIQWGEKLYTIDKQLTRKMLVQIDQAKIELKQSGKKKK